MKYLLQILILFSIGYVHAAEQGQEMSCRAAVLKFGDKYWRNYECVCGQIASSRPNSFDRRQCTSCGRPHSNEDWIDLPSDEVVLNGQKHIRIFVPEAFITENDPSAKFAGSGALKKCSFCGASSFNIQNVCGGCAASFSKETVKRRVYIPERKPKGSVSSSPGESSGSSSERNKPLVSIPKPDSPSRFTDLSPVSAKRAMPFIYQAGAATTALIAAISLWNFGRTPFVLEGRVTSVEGQSFVVSYTDRKGQPQQIRMHSRDNAAVEAGQTVEIHLRRWSGVKGGETSAGSILLPQ